MLRDVLQLSMTRQALHLLPVGRGAEDDIPEAGLLAIVFPGLAVAMVQIVVLYDKLASDVGENRSGDGQVPVL